MISPESLILEILKPYTCKNPLKRDVLLGRLLAHGLDLTDREMRRICAEQLPVCSNEKGYYLPQSQEDILQFKTYLEKKAIPLFKRFKMVKEKYPELFQGQQLDLFMEGMSR